MSSTIHQTLIFSKAPLLVIDKYEDMYDALSQSDWFCSEWLANKL